MRIIIILLIQIIVINPLFSTNQVKLTKKEKKVLQKSLLYPGWGQIIEKKYFKGLGFMVLETGLILSSIITNNKSNDYYYKYKNSTDVEEIVFYRQKTEELDKKRNLLILSAAVVWVLNLIDIYVHIKKKYKKRLRLSINKNNEKGFYINFSFNF